MKLLFDENLSPSLVRSLNALYPGSAHVAHKMLDSASDATIWDFAKLNGFTVVSKDSDFYDRSVFLGSPPQVVWLKVGNCSTVAIEALLVKARPQIEAFIKLDTETCLILSLKNNRSASR